MDGLVLTVSWCQFTERRVTFRVDPDTDVTYRGMLSQEGVFR